MLSEELEEVLDDVGGYIPVLFLLLSFEVILTILSR